MIENGNLISKTQKMEFAPVLKGGPGSGVYERSAREARGLSTNNPSTLSAEKHAVVGAETIGHIQSAGGAITDSHGDRYNHYASGTIPSEKLGSFGASLVQQGYSTKFGPDTFSKAGDGKGGSSGKVQQINVRDNGDGTHSIRSSSTDVTAKHSFQGMT